MLLRGFRVEIGGDDRRFASGTESGASRLLHHDDQRFLQIIPAVAEVRVIRADIAGRFQFMDLFAERLIFGRKVIKLRTGCCQFANLLLVLLKLPYQIFVFIRHLPTPPGAVPFRPGKQGQIDDCD